MEIEVAGVEMGGTSVSIAVGKIILQNNKIIQAYVIEKTNIPTEDPQITIENIISWLKERKFQKLGIASFGPLCLNKQSQQYGFITSTPKIQWQNYPLGPTLQQKLNLNTYGFDTDVNACALAEFQLGKHKNLKNSAAYITVGTGIGVGLIVDGKNVHGMLHPEGGHIKIPKLSQDQEFQGVCPFHGDCIEGMCTNISLAKQLGVQIEDLPQIDDNNPIWQRTGYYLANLCLNLILLCSVEVIVMGGGVMNRKCLYPIIRKEIKKLLNGYLQVEQMQGDLEDFIVAPKFGQEVGLIGAFIL